MLKTLINLIILMLGFFWGKLEIEKPAVMNSTKLKFNLTIAILIWQIGV